MIEVSLSILVLIVTVIQETLKVTISLGIGLTMVAITLFCIYKADGEEGLNDFFESFKDTFIGR